MKRSVDPRKTTVLPQHLAISTNDVGTFHELQLCNRYGALPRLPRSIFQLIGAYTNIKVLTMFYNELTKDGKSVVTMKKGGKNKRRLQGAGFWCIASVVSPDSAKFAALLNTKELKVWDVATGICEHTLFHGSGKRGVLAVSPDNGAVMYSMRGTWASVWNLGTGHTVGLGERVDIMSSAATASDGTVLIATSHTGWVTVRKFHTGDPVAEFGANIEEVSNINLSRDGGAVVFTVDCELCICNVKMSRIMHRLRGPGRFLSLGISPDGTSAVAGNSHFVVTTYDLLTGLATRVISCVIPVCRFAMTSDGSGIFCYPTLGEGRYLNTKTGNCVTVDMPMTPALVTFCK